MKVKYAHFRQLPAKHAAELPLSFWRKSAYRTYFTRLVYPVTKFSMRNVALLGVLDIVAWIIAVAVFPLVPVIIEFSARNDIKILNRARERKLNLRSFTVYNIDIPDHWPRPASWEPAE